MMTALFPTLKGAAHPINNTYHHIKHDLGVSDAQAIFAAGGGGGYGERDVQMDRERSEKSILREVLNAQEKERRQEVTPPIARTRRAHVEVSDDDDDDDDDANRVGAGAAA